LVLHWQKLNLLNFNILTYEPVKSNVQLVRLVIRNITRYMENKLIVYNSMTPNNMNSCSHSSSKFKYNQINYKEFCLIQGKQNLNLMYILQKDVQRSLFPKINHSLSCLLQIKI